MPVLVAEGTNWTDKNVCPNENKTEESLDGDGRSLHLPLDDHIGQAVCDERID